VLDSKRDAALRASAAAYTAEVDAVDREFAAALAPFKGRKVLVVRPVWGPMLARYGLEVVAPVNVTEERLTSADFKILEDDQKKFPPYQACLLVRKDLIAAEPSLRPALMELSGKFSADTMRKLNAEVDVAGRPVAAVATGFLAQAGLK